MIVSLNVERCRCKSIAEKIHSLFIPYRIDARIRKKNHISVLQMNYTAMRGRIRYRKLFPYMAGTKKVVLCDKDTDLSDSGVKRFENNDFCLTMITSFLRNMFSGNEHIVSGIKSAYYDPMGEHPETAEQLLDIFPDLTVVTDMPKYYEVFADNLLNEKGLVLTVSNDPEQLAQRDIAVTSCAIDRTMPLPSRCLVFSPQKPLISTKYTVLWDYSVKVPYKYLALLPDGIEDMYFLSALYTLAGVRSLARLIPASASDGNEIFTSERLIKSLCSVRKSA